MAIPKIIHQVWEGRTELSMPIRLQLLASTWQEQNPGWEYHLWNGDEMDDLVATHFPTYMAMYKSFPYNVQRWDTVRYMILYVHGGVYTDLDTECFQPIDELFANQYFCFGEEPEGNNIYLDIKQFVGNAFMASFPQNQGWIFILDEIQSALQRNYRVQVVLNTTGPLMISRIFYELQLKYKATLLSNQFVAPVSKREVYNYISGYNCTTFEEILSKAICVHYFFGSWENEFSFYK